MIPVTRAGQTRPKCTGGEVMVVDAEKDQDVSSSAAHPAEHGRLTGDDGMIRPIIGIHAHNLPCRWLCAGHYRAKRRCHCQLVVCASALDRCKPLQCATINDQDCGCCPSNSLIELRRLSRPAANTSSDITIIITVATGMVEREIAGLDSVGSGGAMSSRPRGHQSAVRNSTCRCPRLQRSHVTWQYYRIIAGANKVGNSKMVRPR